MRRAMKLKPSLDWLLVFVPIAILLRFWPGASVRLPFLFVPLSASFPSQAGSGARPKRLPQASEKGWEDCSTPRLETQRN